ncbi:hypothetical protein MSKU9_0626 [Komagataeibacter diospyri]|uniref:Uncharacterized protein n=1 Tax=Komagataeibacter diospyri TaxID=1932662 RepID=A0A4P5NSF3_9PROT|nr:hypothetical protein MSKU9_0626 [Komagataeibacter diospyri]
MTTRGNTRRIDLWGRDHMYYPPAAGSADMQGYTTLKAADGPSG